MAVLEHPLREMLAQRRVVEVSTGGEPRAPLDELREQGLLSLFVAGFGVVSIGFKRRDPCAILPRDRFQFA